MTVVVDVPVSDTRVVTRVVDVRVPATTNGALVTVAERAAVVELPVKG